MMIPIELHWKDLVDDCLPASWDTNTKPKIRAQKPIYVHIELVDVDSDVEKTGNLDPFLLKDPDKVMESSLVLSRGASTGDFNRNQRLSLGDSIRPPLILKEY
ncbi:hypothetical protein AYI69_g1351 [Smittium culicis]|uniref:Uncharacterized protein n=1 Tax=Smittium culicis TaxID=133412 RepID=A0A1R1YQU3_9FUNG|nr:hypothetical protein AYI69_g1351 [Smittium culicis]